MYPFLVHVMRKNIDMWTVFEDRRGRDGARVYQQLSGSITVESFRDVHQEGNATLNDEDWKMETWYCDDETQANKLAVILSKQRPGCEIVVAKTTSITMCKPAEPTVRKVTEKGILP